MQRALLIKITLASLGACLVVAIIIGLALNSDKSSISKSALSSSKNPPAGPSVVDPAKGAAAALLPVQVLSASLGTKVFAVALAFVFLSVLVVGAVYAWKYMKEPAVSEVLAEEDTEAQTTELENVQVEEVKSGWSAWKTVLVIVVIIVGYLVLDKLYVGIRYGFGKHPFIRFGMPYVNQVRKDIPKDELSKYYSFTTNFPPALERMSYKQGSPFDQDYTKGDELGTGSYGKVYKCGIKSKITHFVAIKEIDFTYDEKNVAGLAVVHALLHNEAALIKMFYHLDKEHFAQFFDAYEEKDEQQRTKKLYIVMELLEGFSLNKHFPHEGNENAVKLTDKGVILVILRELLKAVKVMHDNGWRHRDIKPSNIFITKQGQVKLIDFGTAGAVGDIYGLGTPEFMPIENTELTLVKGDLYDPKLYGYKSDLEKQWISIFLRGYEPVDIYALGRTIEEITDPSLADVIEFAKQNLSHFNPCLRRTSASLLQDPVITPYNGKKLAVEDDLKLSVVDEHTA